MNDGDRIFTERLIGARPVVVRRRVAWGECDPAGVVYTPRFGDYLVSAIVWFRRTVIDVAAPTLADLGIGTPMKAMTLEFHHTLKPDALFDMTVSVINIRTRTFSLLVEARSPTGEPVFTGRATPILIDAASFTSVPLPSVVRERLDRYRAECPIGSATDARSPRPPRTSPFSADASS